MIRCLQSLTCVAFIIVVIVTGILLLPDVYQLWQVNISALSVSDTAFNLTLFPWVMQHNSVESQYREWEKAIEPSKFVGVANRVKINWLIGEDLAAVSAFNNQKEVPCRSDVCFFAGLSLDRLNLHEEAVKVFQQNNIPGDVFVQQIRILPVIDYRDQLRHMAKLAVRLSIYEVEVWMQSAIDHQHRQMQQEAIAIWQHIAETISKESWQYLYAMAELAQLQGNYEGALHFYYEGTKIAPHETKFWERQIELLSRSGQWQRAVEIGKKWFAIDQNSVSARLSIAEAYFRGKQYIQAEILFKQIKQLTPADDVFPEYRLGIIAFYKGDMDVALSLLQSVTSRQPLYHDAYGFMAEIFAQQGDLERAVDMMSLAAELNPSCPSGRYTRIGDWLYELSYVQEAIQAYKRAIVCDPNSEAKDRLNGLAAQY